MSDNTARDAWVEHLLPRMAAILCDERLEAEDRYTEDECRDLLAFLHDMDVDERTGDLTPSQLVLQKLITMQGWDPMTAALLARTIPKLRWSRLEVAGYAASRILDVTQTTMMRNRRGGRVRSKSAHWSLHRMDAVIYWLSHVLYILAWKRQHPWTGGSAVGFPPSD